MGITAGSRGEIAWREGVWQEITTTTTNKHTNIITIITMFKQTWVVGEPLPSFLIHCVTVDITVAT